MRTSETQCDMKVIVNGQTLRQVEEFTYLGHTILNNKNDKKAVKKRMNPGWSAYKQKKQLLTSKRTSINGNMAENECNIYSVVR